MSARRRSHAVSVRRTPGRGGAIGIERHPRSRLERPLHVERHCPRSEVPRSIALRPSGLTRLTLTAQFSSPSRIATSTSSQAWRSHRMFSRGSAAAPSSAALRCPEDAASRRAVHARRRLGRTRRDPAAAARHSVRSLPNPMWSPSMTSGFRPAAATRGRWRSRSAHRQR